MVQDQKKAQHGPHGTSPIDQAWEVPWRFPWYLPHGAGSEEEPWQTKWYLALKEDHEPALVRSTSKVHMELAPRSRLQGRTLKDQLVLGPKEGPLNKLRGRTLRHQNSTWPITTSWYFLWGRSMKEQVKMVRWYFKVPLLGKDYEGLLARRAMFMFCSLLFSYFKAGCRLCQLGWTAMEQ